MYRDANEEKAMKETETKLNKQISKHYIEHACSISSSGQVAKDLNLEPSRVSEIKSGRRRLSEKESEVIQELYGLPSTSDGHWVEAELVGLGDLNKAFIDNGLLNQLASVVALVNSEGFITSVLNVINVDERLVKGYVHIPMVERGENTSGTEQKNNRLVKEHKIKLLNRLLSHTYFQHWCDTALRLLSDEKVIKNREFYENLYYQKDVTMPIAIGSEVRWDFPNLDFITLRGICKQIEPGFTLNLDYYNPTQHTFELIALFKLSRICQSNSFAHIFEANDGFKFGRKLTLNRKKLPNQEYVVIGKCVWEGNDLFRLEKPINEKSLLKFDAQSIKKSVTNESLLPVTSNFVSVRLFYTEQYKYLVEISFYLEAYSYPHRTMLIEIEEKNKVFENLVDIFKHFGVEHQITMKNIKYAVASKGGYIPSAIYLK